jgi:Pyruvate/2-oxoacid:ferredoxin oxidoreductase delta subunit
MIFADISKITAKDWLLQHVNHKKTNGSGEEGFVFFPEGAIQPTKERICQVNWVYCQDCDVILYRDIKIIREIDLKRG